MLHISYIETVTVVRLSFVSDKPWRIQFNHAIIMLRRLRMAPMPDHTVHRACVTRLLSDMKSGGQTR